MKKLKIAQIAPVILNIPPSARGGTEKIVYDLTEELIQRKHNVTLFAAKTAKTSASLQYFFDKPLINEKKKSWPPKTMEYLNFIHFMKSAAKLKNFDVAHIHFNQVAFPLYKFTKVPTLITYHFPINEIIHHELKNDKKYHPVAISKSHKKNLPHIEGVVYNGINLTEIKFNPKPKDYWIIAGRITPEKGVYEAIKICQKLKKKLLIVGHVYPSIPKSWNYYLKKIKPNLNKEIKHVNSLPHKDLLKKFREAECFLFPIQWEEPFGLVMIEAMACGTPVIAFNKGSVKEVVKHGHNGFIVNDIKQAVKMGKQIKNIKRQRCRHWVKQKYSIQKMTDDYLKHYYKIIKSK